MPNWDEKIITSEDQYETAKARAEISFVIHRACQLVSHLPEFFDATWRRLTDGE